VPRLELPIVKHVGPFSGDKILWHPEELRKLAAGKVPAPITVELDITNRCNLNCGYCTNDTYRKESAVHLDFDTVKRVLADLKVLGTKAVTLTGGGEPTLHPNFLGIVKYARRIGLDVSLITNGVAFDTDLSEIAIPLLTWVRFSLDAHDRESYYVSKGVNAFERVIGNIKMAVAIARDLERRAPTIGIGYLTHGGNCSQVVSATLLARSLGVNYVQFRPITFVPGDDRGKKYALQYDPVAMHEAELLETPGFMVFVSAPKYSDIHDPERRGYDTCTGVYFSCVVGATGDVWICCHMRGMPEFSLGSVRERSLREIWRDVVHRNEVYERIGDFSKCMPLCRFHAQNKLLGRINWRAMHVNFL
jgi:MoaA/NifB/PqqE/SkfB family radical SAM enzyme